LIFEVELPELLLELCQPLLHTPGLVVLDAGNLELNACADVALGGDRRLCITEGLEWCACGIKLDSKRAGKRALDKAEAIVVKPMWLHTCTKLRYARRSVTSLRSAASSWPQV
jgi:hypothetical protein